MSAPIAANSTFESVAETVRRLFDEVHLLQRQAAFLQPADLEGQEWYELLRQKLLPQLGNDPWMVAAVVGGTNIGKSVTFNHLARCRASATSPLASGTKHPVCLVPEGFEDRHDLQQIFPDFRLHRWSEASLALEESDDHELYWRTAPELPSTLLVLDTPDIDSDARVNWVRADAVRRCADVLIAVLTQQKYNDAAVKEFFRKAATEDKAVLVVFNQCLLPDDEQYWPVWLKTFCDETGLSPDAVYLAPADRRAAEDLELPFYERPWPVTDNWGPDSVGEFSAQRDLSVDLSRLRFQEIRIRTLRGSLQSLLNEKTGLPAHLQQLSVSSREVAVTSERLSSEAVLKIRDWPTPPNTVFVEEIRAWWKNRQEGWARRVNRFYDTLGSGVAWPLRIARNAIQGEPVPPLDKYRDAEWSAVLTTVEELFDKLQWMADTGNRLIKPKIEQILHASSRAKLIELLRREHAKVDFQEELRTIVSSEMQSFSADSPEMFRFYKQLNNVTAAVRPMTSIVLFSLGMGPAGETVAPIVANTAANMVVHVVTDVAGGTAAAVAGDAALSSAAGTSAGMLQAWFHRLHSVFTQRRVDWLTGLIREHLLGSLSDEIHAAAALQQSEQYLAVEASMQQLRRQIAEIPHAEEVNTLPSAVGETNAEPSSNADQQDGSDGPQSGKVEA